MNSNSKNKSSLNSKKKNCKKHGNYIIIIDTNLITLLTSFEKIATLLLAFLQAAVKPIDFIGVLLQLSLVGFLKRGNLPLQFMHKFLL